jgi:hypothetical protein
MKYIKQFVEYVAFCSVYVANKINNNNINVPNIPSNGSFMYDFMDINPCGMEGTCPPNILVGGTPMTMSSPIIRQIRLD